MKNILLLAHADRGQDARLRVAIDVARALHGHLTILDVSIIPEVVTDYVPMGGEALLLADEQARERRNIDDVRAAVERENVPFDLIAATGDLTTCIRDASGLTDLVVVNRELDHALYPNTLDVAGRLIVEAKLPVLAVPDDATGLKVSGHALMLGGRRGSAADRAAAAQTREQSDAPARRRRLAQAPDRTCRALSRPIPHQGDREAGSPAVRSCRDRHPGRSGHRRRGLCRDGRLRSFPVRGIRVRRRHRAHAH
jgi:hypothetical protein